ncbi:MAG TPA: DUF4336 domain-containing protein [Rhizomicrobium sp.]|nr:DUF4336 domain-containing protein [Rhizomicrobium sp.]
MADALVPYAPLHVLKEVAENLWLVDGPEIGFSIFGLKFPFPTRMTLVRLSDGSLFVHSPIAPDKAMMEAINRLGPVRHLIASNSLHYWWVADWKDHYPSAVVYAVPGLARRAKRRVPVDVELGNQPDTAWAGEMDQVLFSGDGFHEADFFHRASRTAILTDLIENFEPARVKRPLLRWLVRWGHAADPHGSAPYDMRLAFLRHREALRKGVRRMLAWDASRVILAHGRWYESDGAAELARAFAWAGA